MLHQPSALQTRLTTQVGQLRKYPQDPDGLNIEGLRIYAYVENQERQARGEASFDCSVITIDEFPAFLKQIETEKDNLLSVSDPKRMQIIIRGTVTHFAVLDLQLSKDPDECKAILLDAANDNRMYDIYKTLDSENKRLKQSGEDPLVNQITLAQTIKQGYSAGIQTRNQGCDLFSFDHAVELSKMDIHTYLSITPGQRLMYKDGGQYYSIDWQNLPPQLMKNTQSMRLLDDHKKFLTPEEKDYLERSLKIETITNADGKSIEVNRAIDNVLETNKPKATAFIAQADDTTLQDVIKSPIKPKPVVQINTNYSGSDISSSSSSKDASTNDTISSSSDEDASRVAQGGYELPLIEKLHEILQSPKFDPSQNDQNLMLTLSMMVIHAILIDEEPPKTIERLSKTINKETQKESLSVPLQVICKSIIALEKNIDDPYALAMIDSIYKKGYYVEKQSVTTESKPLDYDDSVETMFRKIQTILREAESILETSPENPADIATIASLKMNEQGNFYARQKPPDDPEGKLQKISEISARALDDESISKAIQSFCTILRDLTSDDPKVREQASRQLDDYYDQATTQPLESDAQHVKKM